MQRAGTELAMSSTLKGGEMFAMHKYVVALAVAQNTNHIQKLGAWRDDVHAFRKPSVKEVYETRICIVE